MYSLGYTSDTCALFEERKFRLTVSSAAIDSKMLIAAREAAARASPRPTAVSAHRFVSVSAEPSVSEGAATPAHGSAAVGARLPRQAAHTYLSRLLRGDTKNVIGYSLKIVASITTQSATCR
ncbi:hypothetical protein EVAR_82281_1 [Eumeta japonica]|uniref:Uncharacterized protein n=1 Tax=Eumeta variegata TaxID=151549 RepID=A0A4C1W020_EUMVA|nr:hypothetical protein EVAR_82281_1 [Eumeta japonica]